MALVQGFPAWVPACFPEDPARGPNVVDLRVTKWATKSFCCRLSTRGSGTDPTLKEKGVFLQYQQDHIGCIGLFRCFYRCHVLHHALCAHLSCYLFLSKASHITITKEQHSQTPTFQPTTELSQTLKPPKVLPQILTKILQDLHKEQTSETTTYQHDRNTKTI